MTKLKVAQIKGCNGSGKTTIVKQMMELCEYEPIFYVGRCPVTKMGDIGWLAVGHYDPNKKMGGCDTISTIDDTKMALEACISYAIDEGYVGVVFEGMMISTIKSTFYDFLLLMEKKYDIEPMFVILETTPHGCVTRMESRGTKKPNLNFGNIVEKSARVGMHAMTYDQKYVRWLEVEHTDVDDMVSEFLTLVGDEELLI